MAKKTLFLGTALKITSLISASTAVTTITIKDPANVTKVSAVAMTKDADGVYSYVYQSASTDTAGEYIATITATASGYTSTTQECFDLTAQE